MTHPMIEEAAISERDKETLGDLKAANENLLEVGAFKGWARPLDCGGTDCSHHSRTLGKLVRLGLAERRRRSPFAGRGSYFYRITDAGLRALSEQIGNVSQL